MGFVSVAIDIVKGATPYIKTEVGYILSHHGNLEKLKDKVQELEGTVANVQHSVDEAESNKKKIDDFVQTWLKKANDSVAEANRLIETEEDRWCMGRCPNLWKRNEMSKKFEEMTKQISDSIDVIKLDRISYRVTSAVIDTPSSSSYVALGSKTTMLNEMKIALEDPEKQMIGVHGMGEPKLAKELECQLIEDGSFGPSAIAEITPSPNVESYNNEVPMDTIVPCVSPMVKSEGYILSYRENLQRLKTMVHMLENTKTTVKLSIEEAERNGETIIDEVQNWLKKANDTVAEATKLIEIEGNAKAGILGMFSNLWTRNQPSKIFEEMIGEISEVIKNGNFDRISYRVPLEVTFPPPVFRGYQALNSRTSMLNEIKEALMDPKMNMIGVHGMGGVGKTTLVIELARQVQNDGSFGVAVIATITHSPDVKKIQDQIADALFYRKLEKGWEEGRAAELRQRLKHEKSVLIILDDIWSELDLTEVGIPFCDEHNGYKLVMISRDLKVLKRMGTQKEFHLRALPEEDSWILFQQIAGDVVKEINIKPIAEKVAQCCVGLPVSIVTVAKSLRKKDVFAWKDALSQLERFDHEELQSNVYHVLELSYNCLENNELKSLFLFIGSFGLSYIHTGELFTYCWGLGFYGHMGTLTEARNRHYNLIDNLRDSSMLYEADTKPGWIRIHEVMRDVAKSLASRFHRTFAVQRDTKMERWPESGQLQKCDYISIPWSYIDELPEKLECPELKLLSLENIRSDYLNVPDNFFSGMRQLRSLHLYGMKLTSSLGPSFNLLTNLCSLNLSRCNLEDIRIVSKLTNLEILTLEGSTINELPKEIGHLTQLRLLNLTNCSELRVIPTNLISSLTCLEELYMGGCYIQWEVERRKSESNNASLAEVRHLHKLTTLDISIKDTLVLPRDLQFLAKLERCSVLIGDMWEGSLEWSGGAHETSKTLKVTDSWWTSIPLTTFDDLSFANLKNVKDVLYHLNDEGFPLLKHLHIQDSDELLHIINSRWLVRPRSALPNLETLVLLRLNRMEEICHGPLPTQSFAKLKVIKVKNCDRLKKLFSYSVIKNLSQLHEMKISNCEDMTEIIAKEKQEDEKELPKIVLPELHSLQLQKLPMLQSFYFPLTVNKDNQSIKSIPLALFNQQVVMPKLETLKLYGINSCKIWDDKLPTLLCFQNLIHLEVNDCDSLTSLFPSLVGRALVKLQHLEICNCSMLKEIFVQEEEVQFPNLENLTIVDMSDLKSIWPNQVAPNSFCKLRNIVIKNCDNLDYIFPISVVKELRQLQDLSISECAIKNIVEESNNCDAQVLGEIAFMKLEHLELITLPRLRSFCQGSYDLNFPSLQMVQLDTCPMMETFCHGNLTTPNLTKVHYGSPNDHLTKEEPWDGDLNTTITTIFTQKNAEQELSSLSKSEEEKEELEQEEDNDDN